MTPALLATVIFVFTFALIASDRVDRVVAALLGASLVLLTGLVPQDAAFASVDFNVIFLLVGTMTIASVLAKTGVFRWVAIEALRRAGGRAYGFLVLTSLAAGVASAFLNNATVIVLLAPVTFYAAERLRLSPAPFLVSQVLASNIGGAATLIGDPPNLLIGSAFEIGFVTFLLNALPPSAVALAAYLVQTRWLFRRELGAASLEPGELGQLVRDERHIARPRLLALSLAIATLTLVGLALGASLGLREATVAMTGATLLLLVSREDLAAHLENVDWPMLLFFVGLFIVVAGVARAGIIAEAAARVAQLAAGQTALAAILLLWTSGVLSAVVDNIPYTVAMVPLVAQLGSSLDTAPLIWALALGANFGGNATLVGGAANVIAASLAAGRAHPITFRSWLGYGVPATVVSLIVASLYLGLRFSVAR